MKRILFKSFAVAAMALVCGNAWADRDTSKPVYVPVLDQNNQTASFDDLYTAVEAVKTYYTSNKEATEYTIELYGETKIHNNNANKDKYIAINNAITVNIVAKEDNTSIVRGEMNRGKFWFCNNNSGTLKIGSDEKQITIKDNGSTLIVNSVIRVESSGSTYLNNVVFENINLNQTIKNDTRTEAGYLFSNKDNTTGKLYLNNVTVKNVNTTNEAFFYNVATSNDKILLLGHLNFENCTGTCFDIAGRIKLGNTNNNYEDFTATTPISVKWSSSTTAIGTSAIIKTTDKTKGYFYLTNEELGLFRDSNNGDLKLTQAYTVETKTDAQGAATLVLPFESTIPDGVTAYKLTSVTDNTITTENVTSTLPANTPVLINTKAEGGKYKFVSTAKSGDNANGSEAQTVGLLIGVYTETQVPAGNYILASGSSGIGFYKSKGSSKVEANHAYMTIDSNSSNEAKPSFFRVIGGGDGNTTLIKGVETNEEKAQEGVYNLNGVRMDKPERKGIYIVNGKKRIVK